MFAAGNGRGTGVFQKDIGTERDMFNAVQVLVERGVDVNAANDNGQTAMHFAAQVSDDIVRYLAAHGAVLDAKDKQGHTPVGSRARHRRTRPRRRPAARAAADGGAAAPADRAARRHLDHHCNEVVRSAADS